ncbi:MAG: O-antigen ligase family protein, partial [Gemmatimonadaceae bacterium]
MTQAIWRDATQWDSEPAFAQRDRRDLVPLLIMVLVTALFFMSDHALTAPREALETSTATLAFDALQGISEGSIWRRIAFFGFGIFGVAAVAWRPRWHVRIKGALAWSVILYVGWACLSLAWTDDLALTVRRLAVLALICVGIAGLLHQFSRREIVALITFSSLSYLVIGFVNEVAQGTFAPLTHGYRFAGTLHPAEQGINCSLLILGAICMADCVRRHRRFFLGCAAFGIVFLLLTRSRTAAGTLVAAGFIYWNLGAYRVRLRALTLIGILGFGLAVWLFLIVNHVVPAPWTLILMGRSSATAGTLTGRIPLWEMLMRFAAQHPVLGYGYNSFMGPKHAARIIAVIWWGFNSAHSAYIETLLDLGAIGMTVLIVV